MSPDFDIIVLQKNQMIQIILRNTLDSSNFIHFYFFFISETFNQKCNLITTALMLSIYVWFGPSKCKHQNQPRKFISVASCNFIEDKHVLLDMLVKNLHI